MTDDLSSQIEDYVKKNFPKGVSVPTGVSEEEAIQAVKKQFRDAGFDCPDETARGIVYHAWATTCYGIAALDNDGKPVKYLPFYGEGWMPGTNYRLQNNPAMAWRFGDRQTAQETADVMNSTRGNSPTLHVIQMDCDGPPLTLPPPRTLQ